MPSLRRCAALAALALSGLLGACSSFSAGSAGSAGDTPDGGGGSNSPDVAPDSATADAAMTDAFVGDGGTYCAQFDSSIPCADFDDSDAPYGNFAQETFGDAASYSLTPGTTVHPSQSLGLVAPFDPSSAGSQAAVRYKGFVPGSSKFRVEADLFVGDVTAQGTIIQVYGFDMTGAEQYEVLVYFGPSGGPVFFSQLVYDGNQNLLAHAAIQNNVIQNTWMHLAVDLVPIQDSGDAGIMATTTLTVGGSTYQAPAAQPTTPIATPLATSFDIVVGSFIAANTSEPLSLNVDNVVVHPVD